VSFFISLVLLLLEILNKPILLQMSCRLLFISILAILIIGCRKEDKIYEKIIVSTEKLEKKEGSLYVKSKVNIQSNEITEHGHCWSSEYTEPNIEISSFTSLGPLKGTKEFEENIKLPLNEKLYLRAFVIIDSYIVYGKTHVVH